jgi:hypothetical protein
MHLLDLATNAWFFQATLEFHDGAEVAQGIYPDMDGKISRE